LTGIDTKFSFGQSQPCEMSSRPIKKGSSASGLMRRRGLTCISFKTFDCGFSCATSGQLKPAANCGYVMMHLPHKLLVVEHAFEALRKLAVHVAVHRQVHLARNPSLSSHPTQSCVHGFRVYCSDCRVLVSRVWGLRSRRSRRSRIFHEL